MANDRREQLWRDYSAEVTWAIGLLLARKDWPFKSWVELAYPKKVDTRTPAEIKRDIVARLTA